MVNKKGYIKTLEATIAIVLVITVSYILVSKTLEQTAKTPSILEGTTEFITSNIELNDTIREGIIDVSKGQSIGIENLLATMIINSKPKQFDFTCALCSNSQTCVTETPLEKDIHVIDVFIGSSGTIQDPKVLRLWFWEGPTTQSDLSCYSTCLNKCERK